MKIVTVVGARPQFIKAAVVSHVLRKKHQEVLVHTGQHFDYNMSERFFSELNIPDPDYNLGVSGGTHAQMTGKMMIAIEEVLIKEKPDWLLIYGDTNSTLAAALASVKLHIPICHVEAGARVHSMTNPEEINRICTDHVSSLLLASTRSGYDEMSKEGLQDKGLLVGDPMYDAFIEYSNKLKPEEIELVLLQGGTIKIPNEFYYLTCHREENTNDEDLLEIFKAMEMLDASTIYPVHPRNKKRAISLQEKYKFTKMVLTEPVGYLESACLVKNAKKIVTDSGGLQREAFYAGKKCITILNFVAWPETMVDNRNELSRPVAEEIVEKLSHIQKIDENYLPFGDGHSAEKIVSALENYMKS
ncbi:UDP-N-acetylglucosamine 2-epimerase (non-hydrolyzing) [Acetatifactor muris]|uniref:UDP-2,3-diacetamido-2,3-dideoxy-D-glucuronate 2-epimerase n=1 Tax=Acetatifactor muris TaxID=879566 RepID=A0A2K4ZDB9_9FIRM|nr:UDP-N-acetylglucosamine 2-epimerase (non-hydrolyzing) [Acetatifactor muris]MCR2046968.1 UDP-N-acetylglucosamine 2-epimerase (non-hydrolyzing) [Acetatifactor muris]SOY28441.1 UDP-2,3-diacetamido-2,3-dideoxy-D-glucuronate 2-epimerase [Acetatifactor muris]